MKQIKVIEPQRSFLRTYSVATLARSRKEIFSIRPILFSPRSLRKVDGVKKIKFRYNERTFVSKFVVCPHPNFFIT